MGDSKLPGEVCRAIGFQRNGGPREIGDPVEVDSRQSNHAHVDISFPTVAGQFNFTRMYTASNEFWRQGDGFQGLAAPFGPNNADPETMNWSHSLYSFVRVLAGSANCTVRVRRGDGSIFEFSGCVAAPAFMEPDGAALELGLRLKHEATGYTLYDGDRRYIYDFPSGPVFMLGSIRDWQVNASRPAIASLTYSNASGCESLVDTVLIGDQYSLVFAYEPTSSADCALSYVEFEGSPIASYAYSNGRLKSASGPTFSEGYTYPSSSGAFEISNYGARRSSHSYSDGLVATLAESWDGTNLFTRDEYVGDECGELTSCDTSTRFNYRRFVSGPDPISWTVLMSRTASLSLPC